MSFGLTTVESFSVGVTSPTFVVEQEKTKNKLRRIKFFIMGTPEIFYKVRERYFLLQQELLRP